MITSLIILPVDNDKLAEAFYLQKAGFELVDGYYLSAPGMCAHVAISLMLDNEIKEKNKLQDRMPIFSYFISKNFLSYCNELVTNDVEFIFIGSTPGGYTAQYKDPFGNLIQAECESFEEENLSINPENWSFYKRY